MSFKVLDSDYIVAFWYARCANGDEFSMLLRKRNGRWRLDWCFDYKQDVRMMPFKMVWPKHYYHALCGLQVTVAEALRQARNVFEITAAEFSAYRLHRVVDGSVLKLDAVLLQNKLPVAKVHQQ